MRSHSPRAFLVLFRVAVGLSQNLARFCPKQLYNLETRVRESFEFTLVRYVPGAFAMAFARQNGNSEFHEELLKTADFDDNFVSSTASWPSVPSPPMTSPTSSLPTSPTSPHRSDGDFEELREEDEERSSSPISWPTERSQDGDSPPPPPPYSAYPLASEQKWPPPGWQEQRKAAFPQRPQPQRPQPNHAQGEGRRHNELSAYVA